MLDQSGIAVSAWDGLAELGAWLSKRVGLLMWGMLHVGESLPQRQSFHNEYIFLGSL